EPITLVSAVLLNMDSQWLPVRDAIDGAIKKIYGKTDEQLKRFALKGKTLYHQIERGDRRASEMMSRMVSIPREHRLPVWYSAVDRAGFRIGMESYGPPAAPAFEENNRPFMMALE